MVKCGQLYQHIQQIQLKIDCVDCFWSCVVNYSSIFNRFNLQLTALIGYGPIYLKSDSDY